MSSKNWFDVSKKGLRQLQEGKPKHYILRELIQNVLDEPTTMCSVLTEWKNGKAIIEVADDSPEGFRDISHAFTLFAPTYKRAEPEKRGRYNTGEKQSIALCEWARIKTTKGTIIFDRSGRKHSREKTFVGSIITLHVKMLKSDYDEMLEVVKNYLIPQHIEFTFNGDTIQYRAPIKTFEATLPTEFEENGVFRRTQRKTRVDLHLPQGKAWLYEMGIPVQELECKYSVDIQQKVPLSIDRDSVPQSFLAVLYAEVLNATHQDLKPEESSEAWVHEGAGNKRIVPEATKAVITKRYGDKVVIANHFDKNSIDEAISHGFKVIHGSELSKDEWAKVKEAGAIKSSSDLFGTQSVPAKGITPTQDMLRFADLAAKVAKRCLGINITVLFAEWDGVAAQYTKVLQTLTLNTKVLHNGFFAGGATEKKLDLLVHELGHESGNHTEHSYHEQITKMAGQLVVIALREPGFFEGGK